MQVVLFDPLTPLCQKNGVMPIPLLQPVIRCSMVSRSCSSICFGTGYPFRLENQYLRQKNLALVCRGQIPNGFDLIKESNRPPKLRPAPHLPAFVQTTKAAITPGTHPHKVNRVTINIVPQPISNTAKGGKRMQSKALPKPMLSSPSPFPGYNSS
jgi:hypothetical protein